MKTSKPWKNSVKFRSKKAFFTNPIVDIFVYFVFAMFVIFALSISAFTSGTIKRSIKSDFQDIDAEKIMLSYLRTPVKIDSSNTLISDLFPLLYLPKDEESKKIYKKILEEDIKKILFTQERFLCWSLVFPKDTEDRKQLDKISACNFDGNKTTEIRKIRIIDFYFPIYNEEPIRVQLRYGHFENKARLENYQYI